MTTPNFLFFITDDQTFESIKRMPRLFSSLAPRGVFFSNAFTCASICQTARATMLTGQYSHNNGVLGNETSYTVLDETKMLPYLLKQAGYDTRLIGKYLNTWTTSHAAPQGWTDWHAITPGPYYSYDINDNGSVTTAGTSASDYSTTLISSRLQTALAAASQPFYIHVGFNAPHVASDALSAATPSPDYQGCISTSKTFPKNADWNLADVSRKPQYVQNLPTIDGATESTINSNWRAVTETLFSVDKAIKTAIDYLVTSGKISNTYIIFTSDNGYFNGEQRFNVGKVAPYENSIHIPLIIAGPSGSVVQGKTCNNLVTHADITATILALANVSPAVSQDGISLVPYLAAPTTADQRSNVFIEYLGSGDYNSVTDYRCVRSKDWKYTEYTTGEKELYDLNADPFEVTNVVNVAANASTVASMAALVVRGTNCSGSGCVL